MYVCACLFVYVYPQKKPRLAVRLVLQSKLDELAASVGVVCSTWVPVNAGTSKRDILCPMGDENVVAVRKGNKMVSRTSGLK